MVAALDMVIVIAIAAIPSVKGENMTQVMAVQMIGTMLMVNVTMSMTVIVNEAIDMVGALQVDMETIITIRMIITTVIGIGTQTIAEARIGIIRTSFLLLYSTASPRK